MKKLFLILNLIFSINLWAVGTIHLSDDQMTATFKLHFVFHGETNDVDQVEKITNEVRSLWSGRSINDLKDDYPLFVSYKNKSYLLSLDITTEIIPDSKFSSRVRRALQNEVFVKINHNNNDVSNADFEGNEINLYGFDELGTNAAMSHELGHLLGLDHPDCFTDGARNGVMCPRDIILINGKYYSADQKPYLDLNLKNPTKPRRVIQEDINFVVNYGLIKIKTALN